MRSTAIGLIVSLILATSAFAQEATTWRTVAGAIPLGSKVKIQMLEGKRVTGTLMRVDDTGMTIKRNTRLPEPAVVITYDTVANLERDHGGMNWAKIVGAGVAAGAGAILTIFVIALQFD